MGTVEIQMVVGEVAVEVSVDGLGNVSIRELDEIENSQGFRLVDQIRQVAILEVQRAERLVPECVLVSSDDGGDLRRGSDGAIPEQASHARTARTTETPTH